MIAVDTNILIYAHRAESEWHGQADRVLTELAEGNSLWAIPWPCVHEFFSIVTHPRIFSKPTPQKEVLLQIDFWLESPTLNLISESSVHWEVMKKILIKSKTKGPKAHDARIAAICLQHGVNRLYSADRDFSNFPKLKVKNPLIEGVFSE